MALTLRVRPIRRLLARYKLPRRAHLDQMTNRQFERYVRSIGAQAEAEEALARFREESH